MKKTDLINGYQKGEMRLLTGYKFYTGVICTLGAAMTYNRAADLAHSFRYDVPSLDSRHIALIVAASA